MIEIVGIRFKKGGKVYYFSPVDNIKAVVGEKAIVETSRGTECGTIVIENRMVSEKTLTSPLKPILRIATKEDLEIIKQNRQKEQEAFEICQQKIKTRNLKMNLVEVEYTFDRNKMLFYFTAETRVDFRELVKDLAAIFRTRIELRQIGVRDQAKILGGLGICGREFCCKNHQGEFQPVSIKMAKEQGLSLNPVKISGTCGRLMCCLKHEQNAYEALLKITPKAGAIIITPDGNKGTVIESNLITGKLKIKPEKSDVPVIFDRSEIKLVRDAEIKVNNEELKNLKKLEE